MNEVFLQELQSFQTHENIWCYIILLNQTSFFDNSLQILIYLVKEKKAVYEHRASCAAFHFYL